MTPVTFKQYSSSSGTWTLIIERIVGWQEINYNGNAGTRVYLDSGMEYLVGDLPHEIEAKIRNAIDAKKGM